MPDNDDEYLTGLLASLGDSAPHPMSSVERAITDGRARRRRRRQRVSVIGAVAVVAALAAAVPAMLPRDGAAPAPASLPSVAPSPSPAVPAAPAACQAQLLPEPPGTTGSQVVAADPTGRYQVGYAWHGADWAVVVWDRGRLDSVTTVPGPRPIVAGVNSDGVVTGYTTPKQLDLRSASPLWTITSGKLTFLRLPTGATEFAQYRVEGIDAAGDVVGIGYNLVPTQSRSAASLVVWPADDPAAPRVLGLPAGTTLATPAALGLASIDDEGRVYAALTPAGEKPGVNAPVPYVWSPAGVATKVPVPAGFTATRLTGRGQMLGELTGTPAFGSLDVGTGQLTRYPSPIIATQVNRWGWAVGSLYGKETAAVFAGQIVKLPVPVTKPPAATEARTISDSGTAIGGVLTLAETSHAILWTCQ